MTETQIARAELAAAEREMALAMVDGINVHGAMSAFVGATDNYEEARVNDDTTIDCNVKYLLESYPHARMVFNHDGRLNLIDSLSLTFIEMREQLAGRTV